MLLRLWLVACVLMCLVRPAFAADVRRVALVIGISSYERLPGELARDAPRADAARVAAALEQAGGYSRVRLLTDATATHENILAVLREQISKEVDDDDIFLLYFAGHGLGADYGDPRLLAYDTDPDALEATSFSVRELAAHIEEWVPAGRYVVLTDAAFEGQMAGLALLGPTGNDWPQFKKPSFVLSSAAPRQTAGRGVFARALIEGINGRADVNGDRGITASELNGWLVLAVPEVTGGKQLPTVQGNYDPSIEVARRPTVAAVAPDAATPIASSGTAAVGTQSRTSVRVDKAKFVFSGGSEPTVQCAGGPAVACDPSCYVWDFESGPCRVAFDQDGREVSGEVDVRYRGAYTCGAYMGALQCSSPPPPTAP